jgi:membrane-associated phospholipid phosphatase
MERPSEVVFRGEIRDVLDFAELRADRAPEILTQIDSQLAFWASVVQMRGDMATKTYELLNAALQLAIFVEMRFKHELGCWRPVNYSPEVQPHITTPGHGTLPMGHAAQAYMTASILWKLADTAGARTEIRDMLMRHAFRMSFNRIVAGVHFPVDLPAGAALGMALGEYFIKRCGASSAAIPTSANLQRWTFNATNYTNNKITKANFVDGYMETGATATAPVIFAEARATQHLWSAAVGEWAKRQP